MPPNAEDDHMKLGPASAPLAILVLTLAVSPGCGRGDVITDPVGYSDFYVRNDGIQPIVLRYVVAQSFGPLGPGGAVLISPGSQAFLLHAASLASPPPQSVFSTIEVREPGENGRVLYRQAPVVDSAWQEAWVKAAKPAARGFTFVYTDALAAWPPG
jgi:hypothetical protein